MPIPLGVLAVAGAGGGGGAAGNAYEQLESVILTGVNTVTFSNLNSSYGSTYQHLQLRMVVQSTRASSLDGVMVTFNGDTAGNYSYHFLQGGNPPSVTSSAAANASKIFGGYIPGTTNSTSWSPVIMDILDPFETTKNKTTRSLCGQVDTNWQLVTFTSGSWRNTAALTSITVAPDVGSAFSIGSRFSIYGMRSS